MLNKLLKIIYLITLLYLPINKIFAQDGYQSLAPIQADGKNLVDGSNFGSYLAGLYNLGIAVAAILAVIMIVFAGFEYMTSEAFTSKANAKNKLKYAIIGLILALGSYLILYTINPQILKVGLTFDSVGKRHNINLGKPTGGEGGRNLAMFGKGFFSDEDLKTEDGRKKIKDFVDIIIGGSNQYRPEELVYPLVEEVFGNPDYSQNQLDYLKEIQPGLYQNAENIFNARKALGDVYEKPISKETATQTVFDNLTNINELFENNDVRGLQKILNNNARNFFNKNNFTDALNEIYNSDTYKINGKNDPRIENIFQSVEDMSKHGIVSNQPFTTEQWFVYNTMQSQLKKNPPTSDGLEGDDLMGDVSNSFNEKDQ